MRTILAILAALAIASTARAETEALVTDTNNNVISGRSGALVLTNEISPPSISFPSRTIDDEGVSEGNGYIINFSSFWIGAEDIPALSWGEDFVFMHHAVDFGTNAAATRTNLGLGGTNTPAFAGLTLTTLTNATGPNLVLADTNGQLTTGSVPSGGAPEGAVLTVVGGTGTFVPPNATTLRLSTNFLATTNVAQPVPELAFNAEANTTYLFFVSAHLSLPTGGGGYEINALTPPMSNYATNASSSSGVGMFAAVSTVVANSTLLSATNVRVSRGATSAATSGYSGPALAVFLASFTTNGTVQFAFSQAAANTNAATLLSNSAVYVLPLE
jgi:hypothetical protein